MGEKWSKNFFHSFFLIHFPPCLALFFFQTTKNKKFSIYPYLTFFSTRVLETHLGGLKAALLVLSYSNSAQVLGMEQPREGVKTSFKAALKQLQMV